MQFIAWRPSQRTEKYAKTRRLQLSTLALLTLLGASARAAETRDPKVDVTKTASARVMILGVGHLVRRRDIHSSVFQDSPLSAKRQVQIADVIQRLSRFHPTKVLVEEPIGEIGNPAFTSRYRRFLTGQFTLPADESYQFGFRLAAHAGDSSIYPINTFGPMPTEENSAAEKRQAEFLQAHFAAVSTPAFKTLLFHQNVLERSGTYLDVLRYLNTDAAIRANASIYSVLVGMGREADNAGSAYVSQWYTRNCYIFSNILSVVRPGDRVVVIIGQGHEYLLREFVQLNPDLVFVDSLNYLK